MKACYTFSVLFFCFSAKLSAQCHADVQVTSNGTGGYTFRAINLTDTSEFTKYYWRLNSDTLPFDSNTLQTTLTFDSNGSYQVCLSISDTSTQCILDTCKLFSVTDAEYYPLLDSVNIWHFTGNNVGVKTNPPYDSRSFNCSYPGYAGVYFTGSDTLIDSLFYKTLFNSEPGSACFFGFIREDTVGRKIYFKDNLSNPEILIYDFSMKIGDTISLQFWENHWGAGVYFGNGNYSLDSIKPFYTQKGIRNAYYLNCDTCRYKHTLPWVQGVGNTGDLIYLYSANLFGQLFNCGSWNQNNFPYTFYQILICFEHNQKVYYDTCALAEALFHNPCIFFQDSCHYGLQCGAIQEIPSLSSFTISPNPASDNIVLELDVKQSNEFSIVLQNLEGKQISSENNLGWLREGKHNTSISVSNLSSGFYLAGCRTDEGTVYRKLVIQR